MTNYLLDSSSFMSPFNSYYSLEYVPGFWDALIREHQKGYVYTINAVKSEILKREDGLSQWIQSAELQESFFLEEDEQMQECYRKIITWVNSHHVFSDAHKQKFASGADALLIAYAQAHGFTVVTEEKVVNDPKTVQVKIPNVCKQFGVPYVNVVTMIQSLNVRLILEGPERYGLFSQTNNK